MFGFGKKKIKSAPFIGGACINSVSATQYNLAHEGYLNPTVFACVELIAKAIGALDFVVTRGDDNEPLTGTPIQKLFAHPNIQQDFTSFITQGVRDYLIYGECFYIRTPTLYPADDRRPDAISKLTISDPTSLYRLQGVTAVYDKGDPWVPAFFKKGDVTHRVDKTTGISDILWIKNADITDHQKSMSILMGCKTQIELTNEGALWSKQLVKNRGIAPYAVFFDSKGVLGQVDNVRQIELAKALGERHKLMIEKGTPMLLSGGCDKVQPLGLSPDDVNFTETNLKAQREICNVFGIPSQLIVQGQSTYSNFEQGEIAFYNNAILPTAKLFVNSLQNWLNTFYKEDYVISIDEDKLPQAQADRALLYGRLEKAAFLTPNEKREVTGYKPLIGDQYDELSTRPEPTVAQEKSDLKSAGYDDETIINHINNGKSNT